jgi:hypothetical protein
MAGAPQYDGGFWWMFAEFSHVTCRMSQPRHCWEPSVLLEMVCNLLHRFLEKHFRDRCDGNHRNLVERNIKKVCHAVSTGCPEHYYFLGKTSMWWSTQVRLDQPWWSEQYSDVFCEQTSNWQVNMKESTESTESMRLKLVDPVAATGWVGNMQHPQTLASFSSRCSRSVLGPNSWDREDPQKITISCHSALECTVFSAHCCADMFCNALI